MKCPVCTATWNSEGGTLCPQCGYDVAAPNARDFEKIRAARERFRNKVTAYSPDARVTQWDVIRPWISVVLGFIIFCLWLRACATHGRMFF